MNLSEKLRQIIQDSGLSLPKFAHRVGVSKNTLINYRDGKTLPPIDFIERICIEFSVNPTSLVLDEGPLYRKKSWLEVITLNLPPDIDETQCAGFLVLEAMRKTGIILTPTGLEKLIKIVQEDIWDGMVDGAANTLIALVKAIPRWGQEKNKK